MGSVALSPDELASRLAAWDGSELALATINGPRSVVIAGDVDAVEAFIEHCHADEIRARRVAVDYASHSRHIEAVRDELIAALEGIAPHRAEIPLVSTVTGHALETDAMDAEYWYRGTRQTVLYEPAIRALLQDGYRSFVEVSPHPVLTAGTQETIDATAEDPGEIALVGSLRRDHGGIERFLGSLAELDVRGGAVDWSLLFPGARRVALPTYAFQRERYWLPVGSKLAALPAEATPHPPPHPRDRRAGCPLGATPLRGSARAAARRDAARRNASGPCSPSC